MNKTHYVYGLDVIRLAAAVFVSLFHFTWVTPGPVRVLFGWVAVQIFFVISGLVIAQSVVATTPAQFLKRRFLRLWPTAWIALAVNVVCLLITPRVAYTAHRLAVFLTLRKAVYSFFLFGPTFVASVYWTLPIELTFYAVVFAVLLVRGKPCLRGVALGLTLLSLPYQILLGLHEAHVIAIPWIDLHYGQLNCLLVRHGCFFALGIYIHLDGRSRLTAKTAIIPALALLLCCIEIFARCVELAVVTGSPPQLPAALGLFLVTLVAIVLIVRNADRTVLSDRAKRVVRTAGLMTYPYYLVHECVGGLALYAFAGLPFEAALILTILVVGAVATFITVVAEPPLRRVLRAVLFPPQAGKATALVP